MHGFFYFAAGVNAPHPKHDALTRWGLGYACDGNGDIVRRDTIGTGPGGKPGVVFSRPGCGDLGYYADKQTWRQIPPQLLADGAPPVWIGYDRRALPGPDNLRRVNQLAGHSVKLADGQHWLCPAAIAIDAENIRGDSPDWARTLPMRSTLDDEGHWQRSDLRSEYVALWEVAKAYWFAFHDAAIEVEPGTAGVRFDFAGAHDAVVTCLAANYRVGPVECDLLGLLDETVLTEVLQASIDWPTYRLWIQKKTEQGLVGGDSSVGHAA